MASLDTHAPHIVLTPLRPKGDFGVGLPYTNVTAQTGSRFGCDRGLEASTVAGLTVGRLEVLIMRSSLLQRAADCARCGLLGRQRSMCMV